MVNWCNYFLTSKDSRLTEGHLKADNLYKKILEHDGSTAFCCYFDLDESLLKHEFWCGEYDSENKKLYYYLPQGQVPAKDHYKPEITFTQYEGVCRPAMGLVSFDFDSKENPELALNDVRGFVEWLAIDDLYIFYSGSKGFHVLVPFEYFGLAPDIHLPNQLKDMAKLLAETYKTLDTSIYNYNRKFRVPFTKHDSTGNYKTMVPVSLIKNLTIEAIVDNSKHHSPYDFIVNNSDRKPLEVIRTVIETSQRKSYEVEKDRAGSKEKPSKFEAFDGKLCIKKLLESRCDDVGRNNAALRIVNDFYRTGKTREACEEILYKWCDTVKLPKHEVTAIIVNIYERGANYNFGCQDEIKSLYCSAKCPIWKKLDPDKRPVTVDQPGVDASNVREFVVVKEALEKTFKCEYDDFRGEFFGGLIVKQGINDIFYYTEGKWEHLEAAGINKIKRRFNVIAKMKVSAKNLDQMFKMFLNYVPDVPKNVDMFRPNPLCANFNNGTLHLIEKFDGTFCLEFKDHSPKDFLTFKINFDYHKDHSRMNERFMEFLDNCFADDSDKKEKINAISEMYGAALIPYFPHLFYLYGKANSGKSSIIILLKQLLEDSNVCSVEPKDFYGFNLESMAGKLVNMVTDIDTKREIADNIVKQIEDRVPLTIRRKNRQDIRAPLPSVHIFGGNGLPKSNEGYSNAMQRRWTIVKFNKIFGGKASRSFVNQVFSSDPQGLINFALMGLARLVESQGYFTTFDSSAKEVEKWNEESDTVSQFLDEVLNGEGETNLIKGDKFKIERKALWDIFSIWQENSVIKIQHISKFTFYKSMDAKGYKVKVMDGVRKFEGLGELTAKHVAQNTSSQPSAEI